MTDHKVGGHFAAMQRSESVINLWKLFKKDQRKEKDHMCFFAPFYFRWFRSNTRNARDPRLSQGTDAPLAARSIFYFAVIMHERVGHVREKKTKQNTSCKVGTGDR